MTRPKHTEAIRRGFKILTMVSRAPLSSRDIHSRINDSGIDVTERTIERDLKELPDIFPQMIEVDDRSKPYTYRRPRDARSHSGMSPDEAVCLELAYTYLNPLLPNTSLDNISRYLKEAEAVLNETSSTKMKRWKDKVQTVNEGFQLKQAKIKDGILENIHKALWEGRTVSAKYKGAKSNVAKDYVLHPAGIVNRGRICYLICSFDDDAKKVTYLPLHRFYSVGLIYEQQSRHHNEKVANLTKNLFGFNVGREKIKIKLKFSMDAGRHLYETPLSNKQKIHQSKDGYIIVEDTVPGGGELSWWIRAFGDSVEILKPQSLRDEFKKMSIRMAKLYEKN